MAREVLEICRAKLNLFLDVVGRRHDGFHELVTVFQEIDLADELVAREVHPVRGAPQVTLSVLDGSADHGVTASHRFNICHSENSHYEI